MAKIELKRHVIEERQLQLPEVGDYDGQRTYSQVIAQSTMHLVPGTTDQYQILAYSIPFVWNAAFNTWDYAGHETFEIVD